MRAYYLILVLTAFSTVSWAQGNGSVAGVVRTSDGSPAEFVNVSINGTTKGAVADRNGRFEIKNVKPGSYKVVAAFVGLETQELDVEVRSDETTTVNFTLSENTKQLEEIVISTGRQYMESPYVSKLPLKYLENPQVYSAVSADLLKQQAITN